MTEGRVGDYCAQAKDTEVLGLREKVAVRIYEAVPESPASLPVVPVMPVYTTIGSQDFLKISVEEECSRESTYVLASQVTSRPSELFVAAQKLVEQARTSTLFTKCYCVIIFWP